MTKSKRDRILDFLVGQALKRMPTADQRLVREVMLELLEAPCDSGK